MTTLYVANCTKQFYDFSYRIPEVRDARHQRIQPGSQTVIYSPNAPADVLSSIVDQHSVYGLVDVADIDRRKPFVGLCFSFDKPIKVEKIMYADEHNSGVLTKISQEARELTAAALHKAIENATEGAGTLESLEFEVVEQNGANEPGLNESLTVTRNDAPPKERRARRG